MTKKRQKQNKNSHFFPYLLMIQLTWLIVQSIFLLKTCFHYFTAVLLIGHHMAIPIGFWLSIALFGLCQVGLNLLFVLAVWAVARFAAQFFRLSKRGYERFCFYLWMFATIAVLVANQWFYPGSRSGRLTALLFPQRVVGVLSIAMAIVLIIIIAIAVIQLIRQRWRQRYGKWLLGGAVVLLAAIVSRRVAMASHRDVALMPTSDQPNIFIIGIDALRPDHVGFYGNRYHDNGQMDRFLDQATNFTNSITPLARTYAAWTSVLTGEYPVESGVRYNLMRVEGSWLNHTLAAIVKRHGYTTLFAMDDRNFAHIDRRFGFDYTWGPPFNAATFLILPMSAYPLSNLLVNTPLGRWILPYSYGNRSADETYDPDTFSHNIERHLLLIKKQPIFLAIHFCLPHWPYTWGQMGEPTNTATDKLYHQAALRAQQQAMDFLAFLNGHGLLRHAIVVLISDHGESLALPGDRMLTMDKFVANPRRQGRLRHIMTLLNKYSGQTLNTSSGHGTDVLSLSQYRNVLAIRTYGLIPKNVSGSMDSLVSLIDIKPTLLQLVGIADNSASPDAVSLLPWMQGRDMSSYTGWTLAESGFNPESIMAGKIVIADVVRQGIDFFYIDRQNSELTLRPTGVDQLLKHNKQRAIYYQNWVLAFYPQSGGRWQPILVDRTTGQWSDSLHTSLAEKAPLHEMIERFCQSYQHEMPVFCIKK